MSEHKSLKADRKSAISNIFLILNLCKQFLKGNGPSKASPHTVVDALNIDLA